MRNWRLALLVPAAVLACSPLARADDEIQVYNGEIVEEGQWSAQHHFNYAIQGRTEPDFPGGLVPNHTLNATPEFAYGVTNWFEFGFYVPWAIDNSGYHSDGAKVRTLFVTPDAKSREFFYGINFEFDYFTPLFSQSRFGMEIRPIIGWRKGDYEFIINPIVDLAFGTNGDATFAPAARFARNWGEDFALAIEYYTDLGPIGNFLPFNQQRHNIFGVVDFKVDRFDIEFGVGYGLTSPGSDRWLTKLMITTDLFDKKEEKTEKSGGAGQKMVTKAPKKKEPEMKSIVPTYNFEGCYTGGYFGGTLASDIHATDPRSAAGVFFGPGANTTNGGLYQVHFKEFPTVGGTFSCNRQPSGSSFMYGAEAEAGFMRLHARGIDPYTVPPPPPPVMTPTNYLVDDTVIGDWYGAIAARAGWAYQRALFYGKVGAGIADLKSSILTPCDIGPCSANPGQLFASFSATRVFLVGGGGIEWAWTGNWTIKMEYLYLALNETDAVCGPSTLGGTTFCSSHTLHGIHSTKLGLNYKLY
jgi:opacity protein-like surface antigen